MHTEYTTAMILAGGSGTRMGEGETPKQLMMLGGRTVLEHTLASFTESGCVSFYVIVTRRADLIAVRDICQRVLPTDAFSVAEGGATRMASAAAGLLLVPPQTDYIAIHDCARCAVSPSHILSVLSAARQSGAATSACRMTDTVKQTDGQGLICGTLPRERLVRVMTPQIFSFGLYRRAFAQALDEGVDATDDNMLLERLGHPVTPVFATQDNPKLTYSNDLPYMEWLLSQRREGPGMRIGHGYDVHRLVSGRRLVLGGVNIPYEKGLDGHSDADVLVHAVMDALLGAAGMPDIGHLFPDTDDAYLNADSLRLLSEVGRRLAEAGYAVVSIDATLVAQAPKLAPYLPEMKKKIAAALGLGDHVVNVKATTEEHLGFTGAGEGIAAHAVCLLSGGTAGR